MVRYLLLGVGRPMVEDGRRKVVSSAMVPTQQSHHAWGL